MEFHFNAELAKQYGVDGAIFLHCMAFWVAKNRANGRHYHEGRYWTYNTLEALSKLFPFWSRRQLERIINGLKEAGALLAGNFSEDRTDRTRWYALADCILEVYGESEPPISRNGEMHFTDRGQPFHETVKCNKETVTYQIDPPKPPKGGRRGSAELDGAVKALLAEYAAGDTELAEALDALMEIRAAKKAVDSTRAVTTLLNRLTGADIPANNRLFDTLDTTTRTLEISDTCTVLLSDTVGFIRKLPHHLVEAFKATLEELSYADLLLHVIDASNPLWREQAAVVEQLIVELGAEQTPRIDVFNKCDKFTGDILPHGADIVSISAKTGQGLDELLEKIGGRLDTGACRVVLRLPYDQGGVVDMLHRQAKVERVDYGEAIEVEAVCTPVQLGRLKDYIVSGWTPPKEPWED